MNTSATEPKVQYKDRWLWMLFYPLISLSFIFIANSNPFTTLVSIPSFSTDLLFSFGLTYLTGGYLRYLTLKFDQKLSWIDQYKKRLFWQIVLGILAPAAVAMGFEALYLVSINIPLAQSSLWVLELPLCLIFLTCIQLYYFSYYFYYFKKLAPPLPNRQTEEFLGIWVQKGFSEILIELKDCALMLSQNRQLWLYTFDGEKYRLKGSLETWEEKLINRDFYRLNRQVLAAKKVIKAVENTQTRKLKVVMEISIGEEVFVSKQNASDFRKWWKNPA